MYSKNQLYFFLYMIAVTSLVEGAPSYYPFNDTESSSVNKEIVGILLESILSNNDSLAAIGRLFKKVPSTTICVHISYLVTCTEQTDCNNDTIMCEDGYNSMRVWTLFNPSKRSGELLYFLLTNWPTLPGFDWDEACVSIDDSINVNIPTLPCLNSTDELEDSLSYIATLMYSISQNKNVLPPFDKEAVRGFTSNTINTDFGFAITFSVYALFWLILYMICFSNKDIIGKKIRPTISGKPVLYYHYWSAMLIGPFLIAYCIQPFMLSNDAWPIIIWCLISSSVVTEILHMPTLFVHKYIFRIRKGKQFHYIYSSPAAALRCPFGHILWTFYANVITGILLCILLYSIPNIIISYYLYPVCTIKRTSFLLGGLASLISLIASWIYLIEKCLNKCGKKRLRYSVKRQEDDYHFSYYDKEISKDLGVDGLKSLYFAKLFFKILFITLTIVTYAYGLLLLAELVIEFDDSDKLTSEYISIITALIPAILVALATGAGIGILNKDNIKNLLGNKDTNNPSPTNSIQRNNSDEELLLPPHIRHNDYGTNANNIDIRRGEHSNEITGEDYTINRERFINSNHESPQSETEDSTATA